VSYTIPNAAKEIGISRASLYRKLPDLINDLGDNLKEVEGVKLISEAGLIYLKSVLNPSSQDSEHSVSNSLESVSMKVSRESHDTEIERLRTMLETKDQMIEILKEQISRQEDEIKRIHERMSDRDRQFDQFQQLMNNFQVLLTRPQLEDPEQKEERKRRGWFGWFSR
jgi:hypothetical protein